MVNPNNNNECDPSTVNGALGISNGKAKELMTLAFEVEFKAMVVDGFGTSDAILEMGKKINEKYPGEENTLLYSMWLMGMMGSDMKEKMEEVGMIRRRKAESRGNSTSNSSWEKAVMDGINH